MKRLTATALAFLVLTGAAAAPKANEMKARDLRSTDLPRPRDGDVAVREELAEARRAGTVAAYDLFLARHGGHLLAREARRARARIVRQRRK